MKPRLATLIALLVCLGLIAFYSKTQGRIQHQDGHPYDSNQYWGQAKMAREGAPLATHKPFVYRMGAPYMVGTYYRPLATAVEKRLGKATEKGPTEAFGRDPNDLLDGYTWMGFLSGCICLVLLFFILREYGLRAPIALGLVALYIANPHSPIRFSPFFPAFADPLAFVFFFGMFLAYKRHRTMTTGGTLVLCVLGFLGAFVRETILLVPLTFACAHLWRALDKGVSGSRLLSRSTFLHTLPIVSIAVALYMTRGMVDEAMGEYSPLGHAKQIWGRNWESPEILYLCFFMVLGPFVVWLLASLSKAPTYRFLSEHRELVLYCLGMTALSVSGGNHTDRFVFWILPGLLPWLGFLIQERVCWPRKRVIAGAFFGLLLVAQLLAYRTWSIIPTEDINSLSYPGTPQYRVLASYGEGVTFGQMNVAFMAKENRMPLVAQYTALTLLLISLLALDRWLTQSQRPQVNSRDPQQGA